MVCQLEHMFDGTRDEIRIRHNLERQGRDPQRQKGVAGGCGHILEDSEVDSFMVNKTIGMDEEEIRELRRNDVI